MFKGILAIAFSLVLIKYRETIVETTGKFAWCEKYLGLGGTYRFMVILAVLFFLWGVAAITGTEGVLLTPLEQVFFPGGRSVPTNDW